MKLKIKTERILFLFLLVSLFSTEVPGEFRITTDPGGQWYPAVYGDIVVWEDKRNGNWDIYGYNLSTREEFPITTDPSDQENLAIYGDIVVWQDYRNGNADIYGYNILTKEEFQITTDQDTHVILQSMAISWFGWIKGMVNLIFMVIVFLKRKNFRSQQIPVFNGFLQSTKIL